MNDTDAIRMEPHDRHWIRLRGPWDVAWVNEAGDEQNAQRVKMPASWQSLFGERTGTAIFRRRFQRPTGLDPEERVCVTLRSVGADIRCVINQLAVDALPAPLGDASCWPGDNCLSFDVTEQLETSNLLQLTLETKELSSTPAGLHEPVLLEIVTLDDGE